MSKDLNLCQFIGRLGRDPEIRYTADSKAIASLNLACGDDYKDKQGNNVEQTNWIKVVAFGRLAEIIGEYVSKGSLIYVSGKQVTRKWQDKDGQDRYSTEVVADKMQMLGGKGEGPGSAPRSSQGQSNQAPQSNQSQAPQNQAPDFDDDIPF